MSNAERTTPDAVPSLVWRKSSYSGGSQGECLEVADGHTTVPVRDSKRPHGPALCIPAAGWSAFVAGVKAGAFLG